MTINSIKADNSLTTAHRKCRLIIYAVIIIKYASTVMQGKRKLCECTPDNFFFLIVAYLAYTVVAYWTLFLTRVFCIKPFVIKHKFFVLSVVLVPFVFGSKLKILNLIWRPEFVSEIIFLVLELFQQNLIDRYIYLQRKKLHAQPLNFYKTYFQ